MEKRTVLLIIVVALIAITVFYLNGMRAGDGAQIPPPATNTPPAESEPAPESETTEIPDTAAPPAQVDTSPYPRAAELVGIEGYINADENLTLASLRGKVVLFDFWTYSCINCIRTLPYLTAWDAKYRDQGLVVLGVHSPEFNFEKDYDNVAAAVKKHGIEYPVVLDSNKATWRAYRNSYWPRKYLIDAQGRIRYDHIGEGAYEETEAKIRELLMERDNSIQLGGMANVVGIMERGNVATPEIYFGSLFTRGNFGNAGGLTRGVSSYSIPTDVTLNYAYFGGTWNVTNDYSELISEQGLVLLPYVASDVNIVAGSDVETNAIITLDGNPLSKAIEGADAPNGIVSVQEERLYNIVDASNSATHLVLINATKGFRIYTFTFG